MNSRKGLPLLFGVGCLMIIAVMVLGLGLVGFASVYIPRQVDRQVRAAVAALPTTLPVRNTEGGSQALPRVPVDSRGDLPAISALVDGEALTALYDDLTPGVVNIQVAVARGGQEGQGAGSGFILDRQGHIVTNNHVVDGATRVTVVFYDGTEVEAEIVGTDGDSDLAVIRVESLPQGTHPLPLGDSNGVQAGEWVVAIGNPFSLGGSMTVGIISAVGRTISSGVTPFSIPEVLQTDAAINPGNSGGPLLDLQGEVIGVNAQIATTGTRANAGVGFAIPVSVVKMVAPALIADGAYTWPWLGVQGTSVNLVLQQANDLDTQEGAYIADVSRGGPAETAGMRGATGTRMVGGAEIAVGGDVVVAVDGSRVRDFADLLAEVAFRQPGETIELTVIRNGRTVSVDVTLAPRPSTTTE